MDRETTPIRWFTLQISKILKGRSEGLVGGLVWRRELSLDFLCEQWEPTDLRCPQLAHQEIAGVRRYSQ